MKASLGWKGAAKTKKKVFLWGFILFVLVLFAWFGLVWFPL